MAAGTVVLHTSYFIYWWSCIFLGYRGHWSLRPSSPCDVMWVMQMSVVKN